MDTNDTQLLIFCRNVRHLRLTHGKTKAEMAALMGVGRKTLSTIESGTVPKRFGSRSLLKLCDAFHLLPSQLFEELPD